MPRLRNAAITTRERVLDVPRSGAAPDETGCRSRMRLGPLAPRRYEDHGGVHGMTGKFAAFVEDHPHARRGADEKSEKFFPNSLFD